MIKKVFGGIGRTLKPLVNVPAWMGLKYLKEDNERLKRLAKSVLLPQAPEFQPETFEEAIARLGMQEADIQARMLSFKRLALIYCVVALCILGYGIYLLMMFDTIVGLVTTLVCVWIALALAFKQHFWYTQMKERRLGLTFREWIHLTFHKK